MQRILFLALALSAAGGAAYAQCAAQAPAHAWNHHGGDRKVSGDWLRDLLVGKKVAYGQLGTETYGADGRYSYNDANGSYVADRYVFYPDGVRCADYPRRPRYDRYVVVNNTLVLINWSGGRYEGSVRR